MEHAPQRLFEQAVTLHGQGALLDADRLYASLLARHPEEPDLLALYGTLCVQTERAGMALAFFAEALALKPDFATAIGNTAVAMAALGFFDAARLHFEKAHELAPDEWPLPEDLPTGSPSPPEGLQAAWDVANGAHVRGDFNTAEDGYLDILAKWPLHAETLMMLGTLYSQMGRHGTAMALLRQSIRRKPNFPEALTNLGSCYKAENFDDAAERTLRKSVEMRPTADGWNNLCTLFINKGEPDKAIGYASKAIALRPGFPNAHYNRGLALLEKGRWTQGWKGYEFGFASGDRTRRNYAIDGDTPVWDGGHVRNLVVYGEQAVGDEVMFASMLEDAARRCTNLIFDCHPRLEAVFRRSFHDIEIHGTRKEIEARGSTFPKGYWPEGRKIDAAIAIGSLGQFFRNRDKDFPSHKGYIEADVARVAHYRDRLNAETQGDLKVGIAWFGGRKKTRFDLRSIDLRHWGPIFDTGAGFVSLQYTPGAAEEAAKYDIPHWQDAIDDLDEQIALIAACDLVVTVCQSVVHFAGALGVPVLCMTPKQCAWRYARRSNTSIWYPSVRLIRQKTAGDWSPVIARVADEIT